MITGLLAQPDSYWPAGCFSVVVSPLFIMCPSTAFFRTDPPLPLGWSWDALLLLALPSASDKTCH
ncbi:MAG: hypothetical protein JWP89_2716 [Schlesneria sp.]|nr:hypothetical protein [Schlesneria sp.]